MQEAKPGEIDWIAVDWGTTHCRAWAMSPQNMPIASATSSDGMAAVRPKQFETTLLALVANWLTKDKSTLVLACGMVGARQGWMEVPYETVPCSPVRFDKAATIPDTDPQINVRLLPGLSQQSPADVMRGEETQIAGLLSEQPDFNGTVCMPGTHTKWVEIADGIVTRFKSCMTGELFALLEKESVLKHSLVSTGFDQQTFNDTAKAACSEHNQAGLTELFSIRANDLLQGATGAQSRARLSALLIANEVMTMQSAWRSRPVLVLGTQTLSSHYEQVLQMAGAQAHCVDGDGLTLAGLISAKQALN